MYGKNLDKLMCKWDGIEGLKYKKGKLRQKCDKAKHGLILSKKYLFSGFEELGHPVRKKERREEEKKKEERKKKNKVWKIV